MGVHGKAVLTAERSDWMARVLSGGRVVRSLVIGTLVSGRAVTRRCRVQRLMREENVSAPLNLQIVLDRGAGRPTALSIVNSGAGNMDERKRRLARGWLESKLE